MMMPVPMHTRYHEGSKVRTLSLHFSLEIQLDRLVSSVVIARFLSSLVGCGARAKWPVLRVLVPRLDPASTSGSSNTDVQMVATRLMPVVISYHVCAGQGIFPVCPQGRTWYQAEVYPSMDFANSTAK